MFDKKIFAERVRSLRVQNNLTQKQLGEIVGLSSQAINDIENERKVTTIEKAINLALRFDTTIEYLAGLTDNPKRCS